MSLVSAVWHSVERFTISSTAAGILMYHAKNVLLFKDPGRTQAFWIGCYIALVATVLIALGGVFVVMAANQWAAACLWAGAALFLGSFIGILFGVPFTGSAKTLDQRTPHKEELARKPGETAGVQTNQTDQKNARSTPRAQTLLVEAASWFSKFLAGATFAQAHNLRVLFVQLSGNVGSYISQNASHPGGLGGAILLYFFSLGFLSGLLLPSFFLEGF